jgi:hypothetical protein
VTINEALRATPDMKQRHLTFTSDYTSTQGTSTKKDIDLHLANATNSQPVFPFPVMSFEEEEEPTQAGKKWRALMANAVVSSPQAKNVPIQQIMQEKRQLDTSYRKV